MVNKIVNFFKITLFFVFQLFYGIYVGLGIRKCKDKIVELWNGFDKEGKFLFVLFVVWAIVMGGLAMFSHFYG